MNLTTVVHIAAEPDGPIQKCARCDKVLCDARGAMIQTGERNRQYPFWETGAFVGQVGNGSFLVDRDACALDEQKCNMAVQ